MNTEEIFGKCSFRVDPYGSVQFSGTLNVDKLLRFITQNGKDIYVDPNSKDRFIRLASVKFREPMQNNITHMIKFNTYQPSTGESEQPRMTTTRSTFKKSNKPPIGNPKKVSYHNDDLPF